jgi:hypothetical protein
MDHSHMENGKTSGNVQAMPDVYHFASNGPENISTVILDTEIYYRHS